MLSLRCFLIALVLLAWLPSLAQVDNYSAGPGAGASLTSGSYNTLVGYYAGRFTTSGLSNSFLGQGAGSPTRTAPTTALWASRPATFIDGKSVASKKLLLEK